MGSLMINIDWSTVVQCVDNVHTAVNTHLQKQNQTLRMVIGLMRGGLIPAVMLSHRTGQPMVPLQWQTRDNARLIDKPSLLHHLTSDSNKNDGAILIVDDIVDSGLTFQSIKRQIDDIGYFFQMNNTVIYATLVKKIELEFDVISGMEIKSDEWVKFPWEV